ncbi:response regulator receiver protein [Chthoniobacter flavus Ellin428]|uniref:Response regulator receiver protein n=1 Tax=Chthoniobacter flavus Ellin428 TaxID=497964 RepID=B4CXK0_9BACT|nr:response regulator [Chthoniobacter flavus]EDY20998.1 response regulator receiver protein [Chthoniobacter flavus Ellin428]TCO88725.1 response regulator receiver domain-containing protein [Chthoniobacter flavus]
MVKLHALIIDDNPGVREALEDRVESMGHTFDSVGCQDDALLRLKEQGYDYILLDLELPTRFGKTPLIPTGTNLLSQIRGSVLHRHTPVIVVTAHGHDSPDLATRVFKLGASDFVKKPFDNLETAIGDAIARRLPSTERTRISTTKRHALTPFTGGDFIVTAEAVELCGVRLCENTSGRIWQIINLLCVRTAKCVLPACSGKDLADRIKVERGEKAIAEAVKTFRKRASELLAEQAGLACDGNDIIATTPRGYQLSPKLTVEVAAGVTRKNGKVAVPEKSDGEERKQWFLTQLRKGKRLTRRDYEKQFTVSIATAKRDLASLGPQIEFVGAGEVGHYQIR